MLSDEISNDEEIEMNLDAEDEILQEEIEKAILDGSNDAPIEKRQIGKLLFSVLLAVIISNTNCRVSVLE
ncbi:Hypothetical predicted protein [Paramuricea clavata]|nr:Hypothetical predicted protein [Paramuricea clavata]